MAHVNSFRELDVYKVSRELSKEIFRLSKGFPKEEVYSLTDQVRRSSRSLGTDHLLRSDSWLFFKFNTTV